MMKLIYAVILLFSLSSWAKPTDQLIILTTFTVESLQPLLKQFKQLYPEVHFTVLHRREISGLRLLSYDDHDIDIVISSSRSLFTPLVEKERLLPLNALNFDTAFQQQRFLQDSITNVAIFGYSGYGLMWNNDYLEKHNLPLPNKWESLADPRYFNHLVMSSPARSGTTHVMVENILQHYGWKNGWKLLLQIGGNLSSVSARSYGVKDSIARGLAGVGPIIDSYAYESQKLFPFIHFSYQPKSPLIPSYIAAVKNLNQARRSIEFIEFLLSEEIQQKLSTSSLNKYALDQTMAQPFEITPIDHKLMEERSILVKQLFEQTVNRQLIRLNQAWQLIHKVRQRNDLSSEELRQYNLAIRLASTPPISEAQSRNSQMRSAISMSRTDVYTARLLEEWRILMAEQLDQAISICEKLLEGSKHEGNR
ncbi:ABC transporter substrate-binding protein [Photobacterium rosenbergii]|uniref:ABC transporter substrate-binding protein n=1 Tax=Photobacterium rosenbergii TaxID=294936 RepID=A0A2T3N6W9_9GAMM|nr:ABC transporter substrate-binding protein [Photobacterium rosenbergii]PSW08415.1 ABC transporter substrate-binding protein [Photobacterium rosenbergii]